MNYKFQYFRFLLSHIDGNFLSQLENSREEALKEVFNNDFNCEYRGSKYSLKFICKVGDYVHFKIAKHTLLDVFKSPEEDFKAEKVDNWPNLNMYIYIGDKLDQEYGQIIAVQSNSQILRDALNVLRCWANEKNQCLVRYGHVLSINPILVQEGFWSLIKKYQGKIEKLIFEYSMPNLFNLETSLESDLKDANKVFNASKASLVFANDLGNLTVPEDNQLVKQTADYIDKGGGEFKLKVKDEKSYKISAKKVKTQNVEIEDLDLSCDNESAFLKMVKSILGGTE